MILQEINVYRQQLSVCMIIKDEEENLPSCLNQISKFADEVIIVDTGSNDHSISIGIQFGAKIHYLPWKNNFAEARNESLRFATKEWILVLDADEILSDDQGYALKEFIQKALGDVYDINISNIGSNDTGIMVSQMTRLFRNGRGYYYRGAIHEQLIVHADNINHSPIRIDHYGYTPEALEKRKKGSRNRAILDKLLNQDPSNPFYLYNYGNEFMNERRTEEAAEYYERALNKSVGEPYRAQLLLNYASALMCLERDRLALEILHEAREEYPFQPDFPYLMGELFWTQKRYFEAKKAFRIAMRVGEALGVGRSYRGRGSFISAYYLAKIVQREGKGQQGLRILEQWMPEFHMPQPKKLWAELAVKHLSLPEIEKRLNSKFWIKSETFYELLLFLVEAFLDSYNQNLALVFLEQFPSEYQRWDAWLFMRGHVALRNNEPLVAWTYWDRMTDKLHTQTAPLLAMAYWISGKHDLAVDLSPSIRTFFQGEMIRQEESEVFIREILWCGDETLESTLWSYPDQELVSKILLKYQQDEMAAKVLIRAAQQKKLTSEGYKKLGDFSMKIGLKADAENFWLEALRLSERDWEVYSRLLAVYIHNRQRDKVLMLIDKRRQVFGIEKIIV